MRRSDDVEDLLVLARDRELSAEDSAHLGQALESSLELRLLFDAGCGCDAQTRLLPGDEAKMQRLVSHVMQDFDARVVGAESATNPRNTARRTKSMLLTAALCLLSAGMAVAWQSAQDSTAPTWMNALFGAWNGSGPAAAPTSAAGAGAGAAAAAAAAAAQDPTVGQHAPPAESARRPLTLGGNTHRAAASSGHQIHRTEHAHTGAARVEVPGSRPAPAPPSAAELFGRANLARRQGDPSRAIQLYQQLIQAYPDSMEAADARIVVGKLELDRSPTQALSQFRQSQVHGATAEALWGEAESLRRMTSPEERAVLERIVREFPGSPYARAASSRLAKLGP